MIVYCGNSVFDHNLYPQTTTFENLTKQKQFNNPKRITTHTLAQWQALKEKDEKAALKIKDGPYLIAANMKTPIRLISNASTANFIILDIDLDCGNSFPPDIPYNYIWHSTFQHNGVCSHHRLIVESNSMITPFLYPFAVKHLASLLGLEADFAGSTESEVIVQAMFFPKLLADSKYDFRIKLGQKCFAQDNIPAYHTPVLRVHDESYSKTNPLLNYHTRCRGKTIHQR